MPEATFRDGKKVNPDGSVHDIAKVKHPISSNGTTQYTTIQWADGVVTCDCPGWTILKKDKHGRPKPRTCKHCKAAEKCQFSDMMLAAVARQQAQTTGVPIPMPAMGSATNRRRRAVRLRKE